MIFAAAGWRSTHPAPHPAVSRGSYFAGTVSTPIATWSASYEPRVTTKWIAALRDGSIDAAYVGSTLAPEQVAEEDGFSVLSWVGDHFQIPTVGIAVDPARIPLDNPALQALVRANQRALRTIAEQPQLTVDYIASFLDRLTRDEVQRYYECYVGPYFTSDGRVDLNVAQTRSMRSPPNSASPRHPLTRCTSPPVTAATGPVLMASPKTLQFMAEAVRDGKLVIPISRKLPLSEAAEAHVAAEKGGVGKILLVA